jgi:ribosomal protein RSM22 (predicted rRNA methylase)
MNLQAVDKILDLGSGPLTMPLALWLCRPQDRLLPLFWHCSDLAPHPMELGRSIFKNFTTLDSAEQKIPEGWKLNLMRAPLELALRKINGRVNLITALNVLNELPTPRQDSLEERLDSLFASMDRALAVGGKILFIEPGTRFGGKIIQLMRLAALTRGYETLSPCMHDNSCPFLTTGEANLQRPERWCHFGHTTAGAPDELQKLSGMAGLSKDSVHLSFMLLHKGKSRVDSNFSGKHASVREKIMTGRVVSDSIRLPEHGNAYYVCTEDGLGILTGSRKMSSGSEVLTRLAKKGGKDQKTGAMFLELATSIDQSS